MSIVFLWKIDWPSHNRPGIGRMELFFACPLQAELYRLRHDGWRRGYSVGV